MIWPFNKFADWAEELAVKEAQASERRLDRAR